MKRAVAHLPLGFRPRNLDTVFAAAAVALVGALAPAAAAAQVPAGAPDDQAVCYGFSFGTCDAGTRPGGCRPRPDRCRRPPGA